MKFIDYTMSKNTLKQEKRETIIPPRLSDGITRSGICRNMKMDAMYGTMKYQGLGVNNVYTTKGTNQIMKIVDDRDKETT